MIKTKKKICKSCKEEKYIFSKGKCKACANTNSSLKQTPIKKTNSKLKKSTSKKTEQGKKQKEKRDIYFEYHINRCKYSEESGVAINNPTKANICHLFPKRKYKSLEDNLDNCIYLTFKEHERFDYLLYNHEFDKLEKEFKNSYEIVWSRIKYLLSLCKESGVFYSKVKKYIDGR